MVKIKEGVKCVLVILGYFLLIEFGKIIEFCVFMAHQTEDALRQQGWSWIAMPESWIFRTPWNTGLLYAAMTAILLCTLIHGKNFRVERVKKFKETLQGSYKRMLVQEVIIVGVVLGMSYTRFMDRVASVLSMRDIYFYISGTNALREMQMLENVAERFTVLVQLHETDLLIGPFSYLVYEILRLCFDTKMASVSESITKH